MLLMLAVLLTLALTVAFSRARFADNRQAATLGSMSEQWLAEHRASHANST